MVKWIIGLAGLAFLGLLGAVGMVLWVFWTYGSDLPDYHQLAQYEPDIATRIHAGDGALLAEYAIQQRLFVPVAAMPPRLTGAFLSAEDKAFYRHFGVDPLALTRAVVTNIRYLRSGRRPVGASTITQQVAKNFLLTNEVSIERKIKEAILSIRMERALSKDQILALYLNDIYLGMNSYGVAAAALNYFDKALDQLDLHEMAYLAALPKAPSNYHPQRRTNAALGRRNWVLSQMHKNGYISFDEMRIAQARPLGVARQTGSDRAEAPYFAEEVRRQLISLFGADQLYSGGLSVRTSLDPRLQALADQALRESVDKNAILVLYQPLSSRQRVAAQTAVEGIVGPLAGGLAGLALVLLFQVLHLDPVQLAAIMVAWCSRSVIAGCGLPLVGCIFCSCCLRCASIHAITSAL